MATISRVLVPMDGSPLSKEALEIALDEYPDAETIVVHVINPAEPGYSYPIDVDTTEEPLHGSQEWYKRSEELAERLFDEVGEIASDYDGADVTTITRVGEASREIIEYAATHDVDQIIIGSHSRETTEQFILGRVTETVAFRSPVRVLLVR